MASSDLSLARVVEDKHQVFSGTFGSFARDADMTRMVGAFIFHVLNGVFARRCGQAAVFVLFGGRSQRNERTLLWDPYTVGASLICGK